MVLVVKFDLDVDQIDVIAAFFQSKLGNEKLYMANGKVCKLRRALYDLKQSSRICIEKLDAALRKFEPACIR